MLEVTVNVTAKDTAGVLVSLQEAIRSLSRGGRDERLVIGSNTVQVTVKDTGEPTVKQPARACGAG